MIITVIIIIITIVDLIEKNASVVVDHLQAFLQSNETVFCMLQRQTYERRKNDYIDVRRQDSHLNDNRTVIRLPVF